MLGSGFDDYITEPDLETPGVPSPQQDICLQVLQQGLWHLTHQVSQV